jgi:hypothetical protein
MSGQSAGEMMSSVFSGGTTEMAADTQSQSPTPLVNSTGGANPEADPEYQMRLQQAQAEQSQAKGQASDILTGGAGIQPTGASASQTLLGNR